VGVVTFARFYGLHVLLLPPATALLIAVHIYLVRKHGVAPAPGDATLPPKKFYPEQVFRDTVAIFVAFVILFVAAAAVRVPLEQLADPTDTTYIPRPEWYFLFLFQTLKLLNGPLEIVGSVVLPGLAILALVLVPFVDRGEKGKVTRKVTRRTFAAALVGLAAIGWAGLTVAAVVTTPKPAIEAQIDFSQPTDWMQLSPVEMAGIGYFRQENCISCHSVGDGKTKIGPDLASGVHKSAAWMIRHFKRPAAMVPGSAMPAIQLSDGQLNTLAAFLLKVNPRNAEALQSAPDFAVEGAMIYQKGQCGSCHLANGVGVKLGPPLNGLKQRRAQQWVADHFRDPQSLSPGSVMPPYRFTPSEMEKIVAYLFVLPD
jgi:ubiquinol-cytochrome c reductase cytochrome b subunit